MTFKDLGLSENTVKAIKELGITAPTTVQTDVIPSVLEGKDIFIIAPAGCGKTCSYVFPLIDIISRKQGQNILVITADSAQAVRVSDSFALFNKYHKVEDKENEANVIIASPDLLLDIVSEDKVTLSDVNILVVDDINLIKKRHQLKNLEKVLDMLPADKQNIVFTNRRSKETQSILDKVLKTPAEIKVDRTKEDEAQSQNLKPLAESTDKAENAADTQQPKEHRQPVAQTDNEAVALAEQYQTFGDKTPAFLLVKGELARREF